MLVVPSALSPPQPQFLQCRAQPSRHLPQIQPKFLKSAAGTRPLCSPLTPRASVGSVEFVAEPVTDVKFPKMLTVPGCSESMVLLGTGYREKVFAIIGVKVYAAGFYTELAIREALSAWKEKPASEILDDSLLFSSIFQASLVKSLMIVLVRDVGGKTFWNALDDVISSRIKELTPVNESALSTFRKIFQERDLKQGTKIFLTWVESSKMLVSISSDALPTKADAVIESPDVTSALFDAFFGGSPVSPTLKISVAKGIIELLS